MRVLVIIVLLLACLAPSVLAQEAALRGRVTDPSGLPLPGVAVSITATTSEASPTVVISDADGLYDAAALAPGGYVVSATLDGFETASRSVTLAGGRVTLDLPLALAEVHQDVTVVAGAAANLQIGRAHV